MPLKKFTNSSNYEILKSEITVKKIKEEILLYLKNEQIIKNSEY